VMHEPEKSDSVVVAGKPTNNAERSVAKPVEPRTETKGNAVQQSTRRAQDRASVSQALERVRQAARQRKKERFTSLLHHVDPAMLRTAFYAMKREAAPGVDGMTWETYEEDLDHRIEDLHARVKGGAYRALPSRRSYIPKEDGSKRPFAVAALEDKIVQRAAAAVLSVIFEEDFLGFSYGFQPKRSQHDALDALIVGISSRKVNFILDADIRSFFTEVSQQWVVRFLEHRIGDTRIDLFAVIIKRQSRTRCPRAQAASCAAQTAVLTEEQARRLGPRFPFPLWHPRSAPSRHRTRLRCATRRG
jgi:RNA-directed DNA polymerase